MSMNVAQNRVVIYGAHEAAQANMQKSKDEHECGTESCCDIWCTWSGTSEHANVRGWARMWHRIVLWSREINTIRVVNWCSRGMLDREQCYLEVIERHQSKFRSYHGNRQNPVVLETNQHNLVARQISKWSIQRGAIL